MRLPAVRDVANHAPAEVCWMLLDAPLHRGRLAESWCCDTPDRGRYFIRNLPSDVCAHWVHALPSLAGIDLPLEVSSFSGNHLLSTPWSLVRQSCLDRGSLGLSHDKPMVAEVGLRPSG